MRDDDNKNSQSYATKNTNRSLYLKIELMQISLENVLKEKKIIYIFFLLILYINLEEKYNTYMTCPLIIEI